MATVPLRLVFRAEWRKLTALLVTRLLAVVCLLGPLAYAVVVKSQSGTPTDALLGTRVHESGYSLALVLLVFAGTWAFPVLAGLVAGDSFAAEDRLDTWKTVLARSCTRGQVFAAKVLAVSALAVALVLLATASTIGLSLLFGGAHDLVGVSGNVVSPGRATLLVAAAWLWSILPVLAFVSIGVLFSVATRNGIAGVLGPILTALAMQLLFLVARGEWLHLALVASAYDAWHAFLGTHVYWRQLAVATAACIAWVVVPLSVAWLLLRRREFSGSPEGRSTDWLRVARNVAVVVIAVAVLAVTGRFGPASVTAGRLEASISTTFSRQTIYQKRLLGRDVPWNADIKTLAKCQRRSPPAKGAGDDWSCGLDVFTLGAQGGLQQVQIHYEVGVRPDGCFRAESPPTFIGNRTLRTPGGDEVVNPLFVLYGCFSPV